MTTGAGAPALEQALVASTPALVCVIAGDGRFLLFNPALERSTGWRAEEVLGRSFYEVLAVPHEAALAREFVEDAVRTGVADAQEGDWLDRWGGVRRVSLLTSVVHDEHGRPTGVACVGVDVTDQRREARLREAAASDPLTGLQNRTALLAALSAELRSGAVGTDVLFCDLDRFKAANDTHGHDVGDQLLVAVAERLRALVDRDDVVARLGGDEFVVLLRRGGAGRLSALREAVDAELARPFETAHGCVLLGASVGAALGAAGDDPERLLAAADRHMYGIKSRRRERRRVPEPR
ncbi:sensor domain-containing diguanylate cyclase [uncultured Pseudokineococcus sp.]|uniref:sensor domain-containing diguanylate cyclase n=1 Tax=uncultured Pseudokineococcus sp. TaxID=1642928 RepID=UPI0026047EB7|nr:sensor domain-containing diguanylate cyclase [uncultured Pseudokineococcus sp.]